MFINIFNASISNFYEAVYKPCFRFKLSLGIKCIELWCYTGEKIQKEMPYYYIRYR